MITRQSTNTFPLKIAHKRITWIRKKGKRNAIKQNSFWGEVKFQQTIYEMHTYMSSRALFSCCHTLLILALVFLIKILHFVCRHAFAVYVFYKYGNIPTLSGLEKWTLVSWKSRKKSEINPSFFNFYLPIHVSMHRGVYFWHVWFSHSVLTMEVNGRVCYNKAELLRQTFKLIYGQINVYVDLQIGTFKATSWREPHQSQNSRYFHWNWKRKRCPI